MSESALEKTLRSALENSWSKLTSSDPFNWTANNPSYGQCAVTSLVVQDYLGGEIVWANVVVSKGYEVSHYFNKIESKEKDFTCIQFPEGTIIPTGVSNAHQFKSTREYILSYPPTRSRYSVLKRHVDAYLRKTK